MYMDYYVTIEGFIHKNNDRIEIIDYILIDYEASEYFVGIDDVENGVINTSKIDNIVWGELITITCIPDENYQLDELIINGIKQIVNNNKCTYKVDSNLEVTAIFKLKENIEVTSITVDFEELLITLDSKKTINPQILPSNATNKTLLFSSEDESIAFISSEGVITANKVGTTKITISSFDNKVKTSFYIVVEEKQEKEEGFYIYSVEMLGTYGDCNLIKYGDYDILIDGGTSKDTNYIGKLLEEKVTDHIIEYLIISHPDTDHYQGLLSLTALNSVDTIENVVTNENSDNQNILNALIKKYPLSNYQTICDLVSSNDKIYEVNIDTDFSMNFLYQDNYTNTSSNKNNQSIVLTINYDNTIVFMGGDLEENGCKSIMNNYPTLTDEDDYVIFKALHHGSKYTNTAAFLKYLKPDLCFITAGMRLSEPNYTPSYSTHPYIEAVVRLGAVTNQVFWSGINGNLEIKCDGLSSEVQGVGRSRDYYYQRKNNPGVYQKASKEEEKNCTFFESCYYIMAIENLHYLYYSKK